MNYVPVLLTFVGMMIGSAPEKPDKPTPQPVVVLELFTSQGCSSCPPADQALHDIAQKAARSGQAVYSLSFHVDYWNRLGWQDPFSSKLFTDRQRQYDRILNSQTYTPQLVINGRQELIGSQKAKIEQAIKTIQQQRPSAFVDVDGSLAADAKQVTVSYSLASSGQTAPYRVNVALVQKEARTAIGNGENGGRTLLNTNIVRQFKTIDKPGASGSVSLALPAGLTSDRTAVLVYVQRTDTGQVIGAKQL
ncbi:DUF1223 domain-containing protein [Spirosoma utsteinense]|uniref:DUF1223 domain-containing protein n=1 Tax=Spirosoma utsteinense TaxID=2585773 RepID=A0ABR6W6V8_9BACT|nr:DUF1223 domain-containing protein [Spirosoma utsteinense]MBC3786125.1 hypothetical protein [Spirosoma utsteinense]MBC3792314.1 hypothetical protein [Spirosoma utsteinense]